MLTEANELCGECWTFLGGGFCTSHHTNMTVNRWGSLSSQIFSFTYFECQLRSLLDVLLNDKRVLCRERFSFLGRTSPIPASVCGYFSHDHSFTKQLTIKCHLQESNWNTITRNTTKTVSRVPFLASHNDDVSSDFVSKSDSKYARLRASVARFVIPAIVLLPINNKPCCAQL